MAFRTNKVPAIEERTVSGSSVSFNSAFALPLKACKVSFSATESGTGEKSPSNPYTISGVSSIGLNANSMPVSVSLGEERFGGELDVVTGILKINRKYVTVDGTTSVYMGGASYIKADACDAYINDTDIYPSQSLRTQPDDLMCNRLRMTKDAGIWTTEGYPNCWQVNLQLIHFNIANDLIGVTDYTQETTSSARAKIKAWLADNPLEFTVPIAEQTIQLSPNELSSIIGNNTFSTDTGTLEITFADLQEKSASGSVATFNTALAMPLSSCNIAVNAWQEGSGDPSPDNVRPIHGFSEVNATRCGVNVWNEETRLGSYYTSNGTYRAVTDRLCNLTPIRVKPSTSYFFFVKDSTFTSSNVFYYDENGDYISYQGSVGNSIFTTPNNCRYINIALGAEYGTTYNNDVSINYPSTDTDYHAYTGNTYTIQLGQEVYGAEVDVVNGVAHVTHIKARLDGSEGYWAINAFGGFTRDTSYRFPYSEMAISDYGDGMTNWLKTIKNSAGSSGKGIRFGANNKAIYIYHVEDLATSVEEWNDYLSTHPLEVVYPLATPFDIQLTPTQIETLIGNNTIFADTGDVDLTYKDLDIAKRGSFREVFRLPS